MNIHKHMEAIFVATLAAIGAGSFALDSVPEAKARPAAQVGHAAPLPVERPVATTGTMAVVIVRAARLPREQ
jgi:hypothetical protein